MVYSHTSLFIRTLLSASLIVLLHVPTLATANNTPAASTPSTQVANPTPSTTPPSSSVSLPAQATTQTSYLSIAKNSIAPLLKIAGIYIFGRSALSNIFNKGFTLQVVDLDKMQAVEKSIDPSNSTHRDLFLIQAFITAYLAKSLYGDYCAYRQDTPEKSQNTGNNPNSSTTASQSSAPSSTIAPAVAK